MGISKWCSKATWLVDYSCKPMDSNSTINYICTWFNWKLIGSMLSLHFVWFIWIKCQQPPICLNYKGQFLQDFPIWKSIIWCDICSLCRLTPIPSLGASEFSGHTHLLAVFVEAPNQVELIQKDFIRKGNLWMALLFFFNWGVCFLCVSAFLLFGMDDGMVSYSWGGWFNWYDISIS